MITVRLTNEEAEWLTNVLLDVADDGEEAGDREMASGLEERINRALEEEGVR